MSRKHLRIIGISLLFLVVLGAGCKKKAPAPAPPPPPPPPAARPTASLSASPTSIERGQSSTLTWSTTNASDVSIEPGIGAVSATGSRSVRPTESTTYRLTAKGEGGTESASARITVTSPPPPVTPTPPRPRDLTDEELFPTQMKVDILFDYDKYDVRDDQRANMQANGAFLRAHPNVKITIEGHCDERGSAKYNMGLGDKRATSLKDFLVAMGIAADRIHTISYGKERPVCSESNEDCWQRNRHGHFVHDK